MAAFPVVINVVEEQNGTFTATIHVKDGDRLLSKHEVNAANKAEFKNKVRPHLQKFLTTQASKENYIAIANQALDELKVELGF